ncbi:hypothetical protein [Persicirhabdus sediminis]|uniref:Uncharacterized protein n=1 Tax=Persicirhabdus sediminis TaxID=454144 RepID=A0A8J7SHS6_9BACT|nr:hypothetical protein [Persicirhabdus sediminis]MBK1790980.1 hypothetical protein [Persicirhabdus sediminis]
MKVVPTLEGGLKVELEADHDIEVLEMILTDAGQPEVLSAELAELMEASDDWDELMSPELWEMFYGHLAIVGKAVKAAKELGSLHIEKSSGDAWYSALNQARLRLEREYQLHSKGDLVMEDDVSRNAYIRDRFYCTLQTLLLDFVMGLND